MGKIVIEEMEFYAFHGHYQEEQIVGNRFLVDLELTCNLAVPAGSDSLNDAVNYSLHIRSLRMKCVVPNPIYWRTSGKGSWMPCLQRWKALKKPRLGSGN
jgi:hypothetical protein